jgi:hypothetical protein
MEKKSILSADLCALSNSLIHTCMIEVVIIMAPIYKKSFIIWAAIRNREIRECSSQT